MVSPFPEKKEDRCTRVNPQTREAAAAGGTSSVPRRAAPGTPRNWPHASPALFCYPPICVCVCVCAPCDTGSDNFPPRETLVVHNAPRMNFQWRSRGCDEWFSVALSERLSTAVINGKYQQEPGCGLLNRMENGDTSSVLLPASAIRRMSLCSKCIAEQNTWKSPDTASDHLHECNIRKLFSNWY